MWHYILFVPFFLNFLPSELFFFSLQLWDNDIKEESTAESHHPWRLRVSDNETQKPEV